MVDRLPRNEGVNPHLAFVFSCPGSLEEKNRKLVQGQTGHNLNRLLQIIRESYPDNRYFHSEDRFQYRITNSSNIIHYKAKDGVSEPSTAEVLNKDNIRRLIEDLKGYEVIITFGTKANMAVKACMEQLDCTKVIQVRHLGFQSLNQIKVDCNGTVISSANGSVELGKGNTRKRLEVIARDIINSLQTHW